MDLRQVEYILKIAEENNITRAAEKLFITQSALNQQLLKLEKELGTPLFYRSRTNWRPTEAGEVYIQNAKELLRIKKNTYNQISDIADRKKGTLSIGFTPGRGITMFAAVYPEFHKKYPDIIVQPVEKSVHELQPMIAADQLDIAFLTLTPEDRTKDNYITLLEEEIVLVIPDIHPLAALAAPEGEPLAQIDLKLVQYEPFVLMDKISTMRRLSDHIFEEAGFSPHILFEIKNNTAILSIIQSHLCCGLIPYYYIKDRPKGMVCFSLSGHPSWNIDACYKKDGYLGNAAKCFINLAKEYWC